MRTAGALAQRKTLQPALLDECLPRRDQSFA